MCVFNAVKAVGYGKEIIKKHAIEFGGMLSDKEVMTLCKISRNSYYKYKREIRMEKSGI